MTTKQYLMCDMYSQNDNRFTKLLKKSS